MSCSREEAAGEEKRRRRRRRKEEEAAGCRAQDKKHSDVGNKRARTRCAYDVTFIANRCHFLQKNSIVLCSSFIQNRPLQHSCSCDNQYVLRYYGANTHLSTHMTQSMQSFQCDLQAKIQEVQRTTHLYTFLSLSVFQFSFAHNSFTL